MKETLVFQLEDILAFLPHRPPFLFVDRILQLEPHQAILAERTLRPDEPFFAGHFPNRPITPGVLVAEALAQTNGLLLALSERATVSAPPAVPKMYFLAATHLKYTSPARPGDVLQLRSTADRAFSPLFRFNDEATVGRKRIATGSLALALVR
jgi:3-hydroxyacyl-[acyl-carrier-protein] dehydratase